MENREPMGQENNSDVQANSYEYAADYGQPQVQKKGNLFLGVMGAVIGALIGAVLWIVIYQLGFIAGIAGFVTVICAIKGFEILGRQKTGKLGTVLCVLISLLIILLANCLCYSIEIYKVFGEDYYLTFGDSIALLPSFLEEPEIMGSFLKDLLIGYALTIVASFSAIGAAFKKH